MVSVSATQPFVGRQIFDVITSGMYDNPLMIFREYIQNSVDSIDSAIESGKMSTDDSLISIQLNGRDRSIIIEDNGPGLESINAQNVLRNLGCSPKEGTKQRGFRGIGRLGGLAYCDELVFETRAMASKKVSVVSWDRLKFENLASQTDHFVSLADTIEKVSNANIRDAAPDEPASFFRVTLKNVQKFHSDVLMNVKSVYDYLAQVAPVEFDHERFNTSELLISKLNKIADYRCYNIYVNDRKVRRPYSDTFQITESNSDSITGIEFFDFIGMENNIIASGWYAKTSFKASLPSTINIRGIRIRQGNIEIGGEHFLDDKYTERRFGIWQIGEIHIVNNSIKPNARRDGFEQSVNFERFLEQASMLGRHLSSLCRKSSNDRIATIRVESTVQKLEQMFSNPLTYLDEKHYETALTQAQKSLAQIDKAANNGVSDQLKAQYLAMKKNIEKKALKPVYLEQIIDGRKLKKFDNKALLTHIAKIVVDSYSKSSSAEDMLQKIIDPFVKANSIENTASEK